MIATCSCGNITVRSAFQVSQGALCGELPQCRQMVRERAQALVAETLEANKVRQAEEAVYAANAEAKRLRKVAKNRRAGTRAGTLR